MSEFLCTPGTFILGANYWASETATDMWRKWDAEQIRQDLALLASFGLKVLRVFPRWDDFQPITLLRAAGATGGAPKEIRMGEDPLPDTDAGRCGMSEEMMSRFEEFADMAQQYGLGLIVPLLTGHMTSRLYVPPALTGMDLYTHPIALKWEAKFIQYFVKRMKSHPAILAWESGNETNYLGQIDYPEASWSWTHYIHGTIRAADAVRPIIGVNARDILPTGGNWLVEDQGELSDILSVHPYCMWSKAGLEEFGSIRNLFHATVECKISSGVGSKPCFVEETGLWLPIATTRQGLANAARSIFWNLWANDCRGILWWCAFDQENFEIAPYDWNYPGQEHGIFSSARKPYPLADVFRDFSDFLETLPFLELPPQQSDAVCIIADRSTAHAAYVLARQAGIDLEFQSPAHKLKDSSVYLLPSAERRSSLPTAQWRELRQKVYDGATLYLSLNETYLSHLEEFCGAVVVARKESPVNKKITFPDFDFEINIPIEYKMKNTTAEVLACDQNGIPVFFKMRYGKGVVYTLSFPMEKIVINTPGVFNGDAWKIYRLFCRPERLVSADNSMLTITEHYFTKDKAGIILVNNQPVELDEEIVLDENWKVDCIFSNSQSNIFKGRNLKMERNSGILMIVKRRNPTQ